MSSVAETRTPFVGSRLRIVYLWVLEQIYANVSAAGFDDLGRFHVGMFRYPTAEGRRPSELAELLQITKQSVNDLLRDMEARGYLELAPDASDGRARIIRLTAKGHHLEQVVHQAAGSVSHQIADILGARRYTAFMSSLDEIVERIAAGDV
jgi:DNA-binding MarR family transcriptional regulator